MILQWNQLLKRFFFFFQAGIKAVGKGLQQQEITNSLKETVNAMTSGTYPSAEIQQKKVK